MKKIIYSLFIFFIMSLGVYTSESHAETNRVFDQANLFSETEKNALNNELTSLIESSNLDFAIVTIDSNDEDSTYDYAKEFYLDQKLGTRDDRSGGLFIIDLDYRNYYLLTNNQLELYLTQDRVDDILDEVNAQIKAGEYFSASMKVITDTKQAFNDGVPADQYIYNETTGEYEPVHHYKWLSLIIGAALGIVLAVTFFITTSSNYRLKKVQYQYAYDTKSKLALTTNRDRLINSFITTRRIPRNDNNGHSGGGGGGNSFGGGGRSF